MPLDSDFRRANSDVRFAPAASTRLREKRIAHAFVDDPDVNYFGRAMVGGLVCAAIGSLGYAASVGMTDIRIGFAFVLVAMLIAKGMTTGSQDRGGEGYQVASVILTYLSIAASYATLTWWAERVKGPVVFNSDLIARMAKYGLLFPVYLLSGPPLPGMVRLGLLFLALRAAWRMTSGGPEELRHPFFTRNAR